MADKKKDLPPKGAQSPAQANSGVISANSQTNRDGRNEDRRPSRINFVNISDERKDSTPNRAGSAIAFAPLPQKDDVSQPGTPQMVRAASGGSIVASTAAPGMGVTSQTAMKGYKGRHRLSGLFSIDDLSLDISQSPSDAFRPGLIDQVGRTRTASMDGGAGDRQAHAMSLAGSSIGSSSLGSDFEYYPPGDPRRLKNRYKPFRRRWRRFQRKFKGCIFALMSSFTSSLASHFVHGLTSPADSKYSPAYCLLWRHLGVLFPGILIILYYRFCSKEMVFDTILPLKKTDNLKRFGLSVARGVVDVVSILLSYQAFRYLLQSEVSVILNSKPIVVQLLAHFTLGEEWGIVPIIMSFVAAIGVVIMSKPPFLVSGKIHKNGTNENEDFVTGRLRGVGLATGAMLLASVVYCILRYLKDVHFSVFSLFIGTAGVILGLGLTLGLKEFIIPTDSKDICYLITVAFLVCFSSIAIVIALQNEEAFVVSLVRSLDVIFSFIWEMCFNGKYPDWYRGGGACIIMFCVVVIFFRKYLTHQDPDSKVYKRFAFLTK